MVNNTCSLYNITAERETPNSWSSYNKNRKPRLNKISFSLGNEILNNFNNWLKNKS